jgi:hypothetical protein
VCVCEHNDIGVCVLLLRSCALTPPKNLPTTTDFTQDLQQGALVYLSNATLTSAVSFASSTCSNGGLLVLDNATILQQNQTTHALLMAHCKVAKTFEKVSQLLTSAQPLICFRAPFRFCNIHLGAPVFLFCEAVRREYGYGCDVWEPCDSFPAGSYDRVSMYLHIALSCLLATLHESSNPIFCLITRQPSCPLFK